MTEPLSPTLKAVSDAVLAVATELSVEPEPTPQSGLRHTAHA